MLSITCLSLLRHYELNFGGSLLDGGYRDRDILGKVTVGGMVLVTAPTLVANVFSDGHSLLNVSYLVQTGPF